MGRPTGADNTDDNLYAVAFLKAAATVTINSGSHAQTWILPAGLTKLKLQSASGAIGGKIMRGGSQVAAYDSTGEFIYTDSPID
jgi:glucan endo-1,3-alpha-glucosidase